MTQFMVNIDSVIFFVTTFIFLIWLSKKAISLKSKFFYSLIFIVFNSSYNIMIKRIHDFNIMIPRNFIWNYDLVGPLSLFDALFGVLLIFNIVFLIRKISQSSLLKILYARDFTIILIGTLSYFIFKSYWLDGGSNYLLTIKGFIFFSSTLAFTIRFLNHEFKISSYLFPVSLILFSGFVSLSFFPSEELWVRYGQVIKILDQEDAYTISLFSITLLTFYLFYKGEKNNKKQYFLLFFILLLQNVLSIYKTNFVYLFYLILTLLIIIKTMGQFLKWYLLIFTIACTALLGVNAIANVSTSQSIFTRTGQITDYFKYINKEFPNANLIGLGIGSPYKALSDTGDLGEVKIIDKEKALDPSYKFVYQIPILLIYKNAGVLGLLLFLCLWILFVFDGFKAIKAIKHTQATFFSKVELMSIVIYVSYFSLFWGSVMLGGTTPFFIFLGFLIGRYYILRERYLNII